MEPAEGSPALTIERVEVLAMWNARSVSAKVILGLGVSVAACGGEGDGSEATRAEGLALTQVTSFGSNPGKLSMFEYTPAGVPDDAPLVVALHGCTQSADAYAAAGWNQLADRWKFHVLYPQQSSSNNSNRCFQWWDSAHVSRGSGEALSIAQMVEAMKTRHSIDPRRVYVTGLSAGGAMTSVMLAAYPDVFAAGAIMAGLPYRCATSQSDAFTCMGGNVDKSSAQWGQLARSASKGNYAAPRVSIWQGSSDTTVRPANANELVEQWADVSGVDTTADVTETVRGATHTVYRDAAGEPRVEKWLVPNMGHGTAIEPGFAPANGCGTPGAYVLSAGICSTYYAGLFFGLGTPDPSDAGTPDASAPVDAGPVVDAGTPDSSGGTSCKTFGSTVYGHLLAGRVHTCGLSKSYACANGSDQFVGFVGFTPVVLRESKPGYFELGACL